MHHFEEAVKKNDVTQQLLKREYFHCLESESKEASRDII